MTARGNHVSTLWRQIALIAAIVYVFAAGQVQANGTDPTVIEGKASFSTQGSTLSITNSPGAIIHWQGFSIDANEITRFIQQSAASSVLNRVIGSDPSVILGTLTSNGRVFLINPSGILVGQGARIDVAGLVASTLNLSNQDFLAGGLNFASNPLAGAVENQGSITTPSGGSVYLVGSNVSNSGIINSPQGDVILAAGQSVKIFDSSTPGVRVKLTAGDNAAVNLGEILAQSGEIGIYGAALRNAGIINADQVVRDASGKLVLRAKQDVTLEAGSCLSATGEQTGEVMVQSETGTTLVSGTIEAKGTGTGQTGGTVQVLGGEVGLFDHAHINVSGNAGGGTVLVGGNFHGAGPEQTAFATTIGANSSINADAINSGNGGRIAVWSDGDTSVAGMLTARGGMNSGDGGFIETSGHNLSIAESTRVNTLASQGKTGTWLIDPQDYTIAASGGDITGAVLSASLGTNNVEVQSSTGGTPGSGNVNVNDAVNWSANNILTLTAANDVNINANITATGDTAGLVIKPNTPNGVDSASGTGMFNLHGASVTLSGTNPSLAIAGATYTVINDLGAEASITAADLQGMNGDLTAHYALGSNIDATDTSGWNGDTGFAPIGNLATPFIGTFNGLGHTVSTLTINLATPDVGLFGVTGSGAVIRNVGLVGGSVTGLAGTGALVGNNGPDTSISNSYSSGSVSGAAGTGGLVGSSTTGSISNSHATGNVVGDAGTGGLVGSNTSGAISDSYATGDVSGAAGAGGLVGSNTSGAISADFATGSVTGAAGTGGLIGSNTSGAISTSFATGSVNGAAGTGGLIGSNTSGAINNSYATGDVNGGTGAGVGGLIGSNTSGTVMNTYAAGGVSGTGASRGALIGSSDANVVSNSYWDKTTSIEVNSAGGGIGMTNAEMMTQANFTSATTANSPDNPAWDFANTWTMYEDITYPLLSDFMTPLTVTANSDVKTYDGQSYSGGNGVTYSALVSGIVPAGILSYSGTSQGAINADSYVITPGGLQPDQHYLITFIDGTLTINQKALTAVDLIGSVTKQYDSLDTVANLTTGNYSITGFIAGEGATIGVTTGTYDAGKNVQGPNSGVTSAILTAVDYTQDAGTLLSNYDLSTVTGVSATGNIGAITAKALSLTPITDSKEYDGLITSTAAVTVTGNVPGDIVTVAEEYASKDVMGTDGSTLGIQAGYTIVDGASADMSGNYTITDSATATGTITEAALAINAAADTKVYDGTTSSTGVVTFTGLQGGDSVTGTSQNFASKNVLGLNNSILQVSAGYSVNDGNAGANYTVTENTATGTITALGITGSITADNKVYDATNAATIAGRTLAGVLGTDVVSYSGGVASFNTKNVGTGKTVTGTALVLAGADAGNYTVNTNATTTADITPAPLGIAANSTSKIYGDTVSFTGTEFSSTGLKNGETVGSVRLASAGAAADAGVAGSPYDITASAAADGTFDAGNYTISYVDGALGVIPAPLGIAANSTSKIYGETVSFIGAEFTSTGLKNGETIGSVSLVSAGAAADAEVAGSPYDITASAAIGGTFNTGNYTISYVDGVLGVIPAGLLGIAANAAAKTYDGLAYSGGNGVSYTGFQAGDTPASLDGTLAYGGSSQGAVNVGNYTIIPYGQSSPNYTIVYVNGILGVTPVPLIVTADVQSKVYGTSDPSLTYVANGLLFSDTLTGGLGRAVGENVGTYAINQGTLANSNYAISYTGNDLGITPAALTVAANPQSKIYGTSDPALTYTASGFQLGDTAGSILSGALARAAGENVGSYLIGKNTLASNANYTVAYTGAVLGITPAALNVAAHPQSKLFGQGDPALTFSVTGLVNNPALGIADTADSVLSGALTRVPGESALGGPYAITQGTLTGNSNYALGFTHNNLIINGAAAEPVLGFNAGQVVFAGVINNEFYYRPGNFWHISLNPNNADPGFDVMRGTNDLNSRLRRSLNPCDSVFGGGFCETWSFPQQREKVYEK